MIYSLESELQTNRYCYRNKANMTIIQLGLHICSRKYIYFIVTSNS